jgi:hypothetical protein
LPDLSEVRVTLNEVPGINTAVPAPAPGLLLFGAFCHPALPARPERA